MRLAYVAATRARDLLVVPALGDEPWEGGWLGPLNRALYPPLESRRSATRGPRCPAFRSKDSVAERPNDETAGPQTVCPGQHVFPAEGYSVVWWEPGPGGGLVLGARPPFGVRREELIVKDVPRQVVADGRTKYDRWRLARADARASGSVPSIVAATVREWTAESHPSWPAMSDVSSVLTVNLAVADEDRPGGLTFGVLVHAVLAQAPFDVSRSTLHDIASVEARVLGLADTEAAAATVVVERVLRHELLVRARRAAERGACRRESPVTLTLADGTLVEGIVDLAFEEQGAWTIVDYKTDREIAVAGEERYRRQVALYGAAIAQATGAATSCVLVRL